MKKKYFINILRNLIKKNNITQEESYTCLKYLLNHEFGIANDSCFGAFFAAMQTKGATVEEIKGLMDCVLNYDRINIEIEKNFSSPLCGIIGSGKDDIKTFNISSIASIIAASCDVKVLKNGSRSEASVAGTTDVFECLGLNVLQNNKTIIENSINNLNFGFCDVEPYFPKMNKEYMGKFFFVHPLSYILPIASGIKFDRVLFGLSSDDTETTAKLLLELGYDNSMVVAGHDMEGNNFDEISNIGPTKISEIKNGKINTYTVMPKDFGLDIVDRNLIVEGESVEENAKIFKDILSNKSDKGKIDIVLLNAGALIYLSGKVKTINDGISMARESIESGRALETLNKIIEGLR